MCEVRRTGDSEQKRITGQARPEQEEAQQGREVAPEWAWTEASVWTERMLATLERGIKGGKWFSLTDKVYGMENLHSALGKVRRNKGAAGIDGQKVEQYE